MRALHCGILWLTALSLLTMGGACSSKYENTDAQGLSLDHVEKADLTDSLINCVDSVIRMMTPEQKSAQLLIPAVYTASDPYSLRRVKEYAEMGVGGLILLKGDARSAAIIADSINLWCDIPPFIAIDAESGLAMRLKDAPVFPVNGRLGPTVTEMDMFSYGSEIARECRGLGINMILGPVLDVAEKNSYIGYRSFGNDKERVSTLGIAYAKGLESGNVISVAKHFPGHGAAKGDTHQHKAVINRSLQSLDSIDLYPFKEYIAQNLSGIMAGHLAFPAIDPEQKSSALSKAVITDLLRNDMGFGGLIITDALNMTGAEGKSAADAIEAGADIVLAPISTPDEIRNIRTRFFNDSTGAGAAEIDSHLRRILFRKFLLGKYSRSMPDSLLLKELNNREFSFRR